MMETDCPAHNNGGQVQSVSKMVLGYCSYADRVFADIESGRELGVRCWLTARVLARCLPHLMEFNDKLILSTAGSGVSDKTGTLSNTAGAEQKSGGLAPPTEMLVQAVDMQLKVPTLNLTLRDERGGLRVQLDLDAAALSEWLAALNKCVRLAGWSAVPLKHVWIPSLQVSDAVH